MPTPTDDLPSLEALQDKIRLATPPAKKAGEAGLEYSKDISLAVQFLVELVAGVGVGAGLGYVLDRWLDTSPVCLIVCLMLGTAAGIRNMMRSAKTAEQSMNEDKSSS